MIARDPQTGDLILSRENTVASFIVRSFTRSKWSHVGVYEKSGEFISAVPVAGVCRKKLIMVQDYAIYRIEDITYQQRDAICNFCVQRIGRPYDFLQIIVLVYRILTHTLTTAKGDPEPDEYVCSELVAEACATVGIKFGKIADNVLPETIAASPLTTRIGGTV